MGWFDVKNILHYYTPTPTIDRSAPGVPRPGRPAENASPDVGTLESDAEPGTRHPGVSAECPFHRPVDSLQEMQKDDELASRLMEKWLGGCF